MIQPLRIDRFTAGGVVLREQLVQIAYSHTIALRNYRSTQITVMEVSDDVGLDCCQPHRAHAATFGFAVARHPDIDLHYATAMFQMPSSAPYDWRDAR